jgi:hypothetical protein
MKKKTRKVGRPTSYEPAIVEALCLAIATSSEGLRRICARNKRFPSTTTIYRWLAENDEFRARYARARELQAQALFDEIIEIADHTKMGTVTKIDYRGRRERRIGDMTDRARLQIDARKWALSKLIPKKYGDRSDPDPGQRDPLAELVECMKETSKRIGPPEGLVQRAVEEGG